MEENWFSSISWERKRSVTKTASILAGLLSIVMWAHPVQAEQGTIESIQAVYTIQEDGWVQAEQVIMVNREQSDNVVIVLPRPYHRAGRVIIENVELVDEQYNPIPPSEYSQRRGVDTYSIEVPRSLIPPSGRITVRFNIYRSVAVNPEQDQMDSWEWVVMPRFAFESISSVSATVVLPETLTKSSVQVEAPWAEQDTLRENTVYLEGEHITADQAIHIVVQWPTGHIMPPTASWLQQTWERIRPLYYYWLPIVTLLFLIGWYTKYGRDPNVGGAVQPVFDVPNNLGPASLGTLVEERVRIQFFSAILVNLAQRGYMQIIEEPRESIFRRREYTFVKSVDFERDPELVPIEVSFLRTLFSDADGQAAKKARVQLSEMKSSFASHISEIRQSIIDSMVRRRYFREDPTTSRSRFVIIATGIALCATAVTIVGGLLFGALFAGVPLYIVSGLFVLFAPLMPQKTRKGAIAYRMALGFKAYLQHPEQYAEAPRTPKVFSQYLPYAIVFGVEREWAAAFEQTLTQQPDWYIASGEGRFSAIEFTHSLRETFIHAASQTLETTREQFPRWSMLHRK